MKLKQLLIFAFILISSLDILADVDFGGGAPSLDEKEFQQYYGQVFNEQTGNRVRARLEKKAYTPLSDAEMVTEAAYRFKQEQGHDVPPDAKVMIMGRFNQRPVNVDRLVDKEYLQAKLKEAPTQKASREANAAKDVAQLRAGTKKAGGKQPIISPPKTAAPKAALNQHPVQPNKPTIPAQKKPVATAKSSHPQPPRATQPQPPKATRPQSTKKIQH